MESNTTKLLADNQEAEAAQREYREWAERLKEALLRHCDLNYPVRTVLQQELGITEPEWATMTSNKRLGILMKPDVYAVINSRLGLEEADPTKIPRRVIKTPRGRWVLAKDISMTESEYQDWLKKHPVLIGEEPAGRAQTIAAFSAPKVPQETPTPQKVGSLEEVLAPIARLIAQQLLAQMMSELKDLMPQATEGAIKLLQSQQTKSQTGDGSQQAPPSRQESDTGRLIRLLRSKMRPMADADKDAQEAFMKRYGEQLMPLKVLVDAFTTSDPKTRKIILEGSARSEEWKV